MFDIMNWTNEEYISVTYGCIRFFGSYRFSSMALYGLVKTLDNDDLKILTKNSLTNGNM